MKKFKLFKALMLMVSIMLISPQVWADQTVFSKNFNTMTSATYSSTTDRVSTDGIKYYIKSGKTITITNGTGVIFNQNAGTGSSFHGLAIPLTGVRQSLKITMTVPYSSKSTWKYKFVGGGTVSDTPPGTVDQSDKDASGTVTINISSLTNYTGVLYIGRAGSSYTTINNITVTTPNLVTHTLTNVTKSSGDTIATSSANYTATFAAAAGYTLPASITVMRDATNITANCTWTQATGSLTIPKAQITGNITVTITGEAAAACSDDTGLAYGETTVNKTYGDAVFTNTLTNSNSLSVTYSSTNTNVATVNGSTGAVTIKAAGTTTIKATWAGNATYCEDEVSYTLNVKPAVGEVSGAWDRFGGETISLSVTPSGGSSYTYQWRKWYNDQWNNIAGATSATYTKSECDKDDSGSYSCAVTSAGQTNETDGYQVKVFVLECYTGGTTVYNFTRDGNNQRGSVNIDLSASTSYEFKVHADNDYYGNNGTVDEDITNWVLCNNDNEYCNPNLHVNSGLGGTFTFTMDYSAEGNSDQVGEPELSVTYPRKRIYLSPGVWDADGAKFAYYYFRDGGSTAWTDFLTRDDCGNYADIPQWNGVKVIAGRINGELDAPAFGDGKCWNQTNNITVGSYDYITITGWNASDYTYNSTYAAPTYTISYNKGTSGSGTKSDETKTCGMAFTLPSSAVFTRTGYTQTGWTTSDGGAQEYALGGTYTTNDDQTFYPVWTVNNYDLTWNLGGGTTTSAGTGIASGVSANTTSSVAYGTSLTAPTVTKANYTFSAWSPAVASKMPAANTTYTATFTANTYSVTHTLSGVTTSSGSTGAGAATYGTNYSATFAASSGYELPSSVTVTAGGSDITANCTYTKGTGTVSIPGAYITGNIVITVTGVYAANFKMVANSSAGSDATLANNESISQGSKNCATLTGGTAVYSNADGDSKSMKVAKPSGGAQYGWYFNVAKDVITITLTSHVLQVGSVITFSGYVGSANYGISVNGSTTLTKSGSSGEFTKSYTVTAGDTHLIGKNVLELKRESGSAKMYSFTLSNCQAASPCTTPTLPSLSNQAGCSYSAWNATPSNASTISAAGESISYSWKKGATEKATTASYTPDADGTDYTVKVTVSKAGKITTSVTSSALTATKYGNPSVTGPSDAEYEVGDNATNLSVTATPTHGETLTYQWYSNTAKSTSSPTPTALANCTTSTYKPSTAAAATTYYFCKVSGGCAAVYSDIATVTVSEAPCLRATITKNSGDYTLSTGNGETKDITSDATVTSGGAVKLVNNFNGSKKFSFSDNGVAPGTTDGYVEVVLPSGSVLDAGSVIRITGAGTEDGAGLLLIDDAGTTIASQINNGALDFSYTVTAVSTLKYKNHIRIARAKASNKNHFKSVTITGCVECTPITPTLNYSKTTFWMDDATLTATPTLTGYYGSPTISYASSDPTVVRVDNSSTGAITALKRGTATITATIGATTVSTTDYCGNTATCDIKVKDMSCGYTEIASAVLTSKTSATCTNATLLNANMSNSSAPYKLDKTLPSYFGLQLSSGNFQVGDSIIFKVKIGDMDINGGSTYPVAFYHTTDTSSYTTSNLIYTSGAQTKNTDNVYIRFIVTQAMIDAGLTNKILIIRSGRVKQNHSMYEARIKRYGCPDIFIYDDAADTHEWSDEDNWIGPAGHGAGLPTNEDRVFINESVTVDVATASAAELHITNGSMVTVQKAITVGDVIIESGSTLNVAKDGEDGITVATNSLNLKGGWNDSYEYDMPRVYIDPLSTLTKEVSTVNFDISVNHYNFYPFALPFDVVLKTDPEEDDDIVDYVDPTLRHYSSYGMTGQYVIKEYDGERRAKQGPDRENNWKVVEAGSTLKAGKGYILTAIKPMGYDAVIRFPLSFTNAWTALGEQGTVSAVTKNVVAVTAWEGDATKDGKNANKGWNLLGVPFMSCYTTSDDMGTSVVMQGKFNFDDGTWDGEDTHRYVNVPLHDFSEYVQVDMEDEETPTVLRPGWCFFVQIGTTGSLTFLTEDEAQSSSLPIYAPKRTTGMPTVKTGIVLSGNGASDKTTLLISDKYNGAEYEINADLEKMFGNGYTLATYSLSNDTRLAYNAMSKSDAQLAIPIGYRAPAEGSYTFSINPRYAESGAFSRVDLVDYEAGTLTNLLMSDYTFTTERTQNDTRFAINVVLAPQVTTDIESVNGEGLEVNGVRKVLINNELYIVVDGKMFDATGKTVKGGQK